VNSESFGVLGASGHDPASNSLPRLRIFVSSPGDVDTERQIASRVIDRLRVRFQEHGEIDPYFWEYEPMRHHATFQNQIPPTSDFDVVICILWSRLGTPLIGPDGKRYASGTEYEVASARESWKTTGSPEVMIYLHDAPAQIRQFPDSEFQKMVDQLKALKRFVAEYCQDPATGEIKGAFTTYRDLGQFETLLEKHLEKLIERKLPKRWIDQRTEITPHWVGQSPFRGLAAFDFEHSPIFFGRTKAVGEVLAQLRRRMGAVEDARAAKMPEITAAAFVLVSAMSGVGKSSLVRAGILPLLVEPGNGIALWRRAEVRPSEFAGDLFDGLARALCAEEALPELLSGETTVETVAGFLRRNPAGIEFGLSSALDRASAELKRQEELDLQAQEQSFRYHGRLADADAADEKIAQLRKATFPSRLVLVVDQLEELFTLESITPEVRTNFITAIAALARSGRVAVLVTLRSDFFEKCAEVPVLAELSKGDGLYHLLPPNALEIGQMIREPAIAAGLQFEIFQETKQSLDERLRDAATRNPEALPLLQFCLEALYQAQAKRGDGLLTHADYDAIGGVEGALANRAEETFLRLQPAEQAEFSRVMRAVTTADDNETFTRRWADRDELTRVPAAKAFVDAFLAPEARLLVVDRDLRGRVVVSVTHEALLTRWERLHQWLLTNLENLRMRAQVSADALRWRQSGRNNDYLYAGALPLAKAHDLAERDFLDDAEREFVDASVRAARSASEKKRRNLHRVIAGVSVVAIVAIVLAITSFVQYSRARAAKRQAGQAAQRAKLARTEAEKLINFLVGDLHDKLKPIGRLDLLAEISKRVRAYYENFAEREKNPEALKQWSTALINQGDVLTDQGDLDAALKCYEESLSTRQILLKQSSNSTESRRDVASALLKIAGNRHARGDFSGALAIYEQALAIRREIVVTEPGNQEFQHDLSVALEFVGRAAHNAGDQTKALQNLRDAIAVGRQIVRGTSVPAAWQSDLSYALLLAGDVFMEQNDSAEALQEYQDSLVIRERLARAEPDDSDRQRDLALSLEEVGYALADQGDETAALDKQRLALAIREKLVGRDPENTDWRQQLSVSYRNIGRILADQGDLEAALVSYQSGLRIREKLAADNPSNDLAQRDLGITEGDIGEIFLMKDDPVGALEKFHMAVTRLRALATKNPENLLWQSDLGEALMEAGDAETKNSEFESGFAELDEALSIFGRLSQRDPNNLFWQYMTALTQVNLGVLCGSQKKWADALHSEEMAAETLHRLLQQVPSSVSFIEDLARCDYRIGEAAEGSGDEERATGRFREAYDLLEPLVNKESGRREWIVQFARVAYHLGTALHSPGEGRAILEKGRDALLPLEQKNLLSADDKATLTDIRNVLDRNRD
jgi:tetratricopeptide (TPR) repeat protein